MAITRVLFGAAVVTIVGAASASAQKSVTPSIDFEPVMLDATKSNGATLAIKYKLAAGTTLVSLGAGKPNRGELTGSDLSASTFSIVSNFNAKGTVAVSAKRNPRDFLETSLDTRLLASGTKGTGLIGGVLRYETDQRFDKQLFVYGITATIGKIGVLFPKDYISVDVGYARVDPKNDKGRKAALDVSTLTTYNRWNIEALAIVPISHGTVQELEINYRDFLEPSAPTGVKVANLDHHQLGSVRLGFRDDLFIAYSVGRLPFDRESDKVLAVGFSLKMK